MQKNLVQRISQHLNKRISKHISQRILIFTIVLFMIVTVALPSTAHWADLSVGEIKIQDKDSVFNLTIPTGLIAFADDDKNNQLSAPEVDRHRSELKDFLRDRIQLFNQAGEAGEWSIQATSQSLALPKANTQTHTTLELDHVWVEPIEELTLRYTLFAPDAIAARCLITALHNGKTQSLVFTPNSTEYTLISRPIGQQIYSFVVLGIEHILTGYDHILFLISLLLVTTRFGEVIKIVTAFTVAHSVTLSLAVLNIVSLPSQWVECTIALTIVYVAIENLYKKDFSHRWALTFGFGLVHGLGFAGVLREIQIPRDNLFTSLASFNLGVELGQILVVTVCFFLLKFIQKQFQKHRPEHHPEHHWPLNLNRVVSVGIIGMGLVWFVQRAGAIG